MRTLLAGLMLLTAGAAFAPAQTKATPPTPGKARADVTPAEKKQADDSAAAATAVAGGLGIAALGGLLCAGVVGLVVTFVPAMIAVARGHPNALAIGAVCLLLGWTGIGWAAALIWSLTSPAAATVVNVNGGGGGRRRRDRDDD